jgi:probable addiction module antidote protein
MVEVRQTVVFRAWLDGLRDGRAQARIAQRILRLQAGLMGDVKPAGGGVAEMRVDYWARISGLFRAARAGFGDSVVWRNEGRSATRHSARADDGGCAGGRGMVTTEAFDAARYLGSAEAQGELLNDALESGSAAYVASALGVIARARGMGEVARAAGVTREALYRSLSEAGDPRLSTLLGVMRALGVRLVAEVE